MRACAGWSVPLMLFITVWSVPLMLFITVWYVPLMLFITVQRVSSCVLFVSVSGKFVVLSHYKHN